MSRPTNDARRAMWRNMSPRERAEQSEVDPKLRRGCDGKERHPSKRAAAGIARVIVQQGRSRPGYILQPYKCRMCGGWHVGNSYAAFRRRRPEDA